MIDISNYTFKMQSLLDYRNQMENDAKEKMTTLKSRLENEEEICDSLSKELLNSIKTESIQDPYTMKMKYLYTERLRCDISAQEKKVEEITEELDSAYKGLVEARKSKRIVEIIKEKEEVAYAKESARMEQNEIDDLTVLRFAK